MHLAHPIRKLGPELKPVASFGRTSVTFGWQVVKSGQLCVEGRHTVVHVGEDGRPVAWPGYLRAGLDGAPEGPHAGTAITR